MPQTVFPHGHRSLSPIANKNPQEPDLEARGEALPKMIQRHNQRTDTFTALEVRSLLKEIRAIGKMNLAGSLHSDMARVDRIDNAAGRSRKANSGRSKASPVMTAPRPMLSEPHGDRVDRCGSVTGHCAPIWRMVTFQSKKCGL